MRTFIADIIPKIQRFSQRLDDLTKLTNQHWVSLGDINETKRVFIFRANNQLLVSDNGIVEKDSWEYLGNQSLLLETKHESYLLKHGFFDENIIALKLDSTNRYAFFINESKYHSELNSINDILRFLENKYIKNNGEASNLGSTQKATIDENAEYSYTLIKKTKKFSLELGTHWTFELLFASGIIGYVHFGSSSGRYFYINKSYNIIYCKDFEDAAYNVHQHLIKQNNS